MTRRNASLTIVLMTIASLLLVANVGVASAVSGCTPAKGTQRATHDANFSVTGPAVVEVWYPDASENNKPSWGDALRKNFVPAGIKATYFDAQGYTWKWTNTRANRQCAAQAYANNPRKAVSRSTLANQHVAKFRHI